MTEHCWEAGGSERYERGHSAEAQVKFTVVFRICLASHMSTGELHFLEMVTSSRPRSALSYNLLSIAILPLSQPSSPISNPSSIILYLRFLSYNNNTYQPLPLIKISLKQSSTCLWYGMQRRMPRYNLTIDIKTFCIILNWRSNTCIAHHGHLPSLRFQSLG